MFPHYLRLNCVTLEHNLSPVARIVPQIADDCKLVFHWKDLEVKKPYVFYSPFRLNANIASKPCNKCDTTKFVEHESLV